MRLLIAGVLLAVACDAATPTPSPAPSLAASPGPSAPSSSAGAERFGLALTDYNALNLRTEEDPDPLVRIARLGYVAASPDGRRIGYWQIGTDLVPELVVYDTLAGTTRRLHALAGPSLEFSNDAVWSPGSDRIAFSVRSTEGPAGEFDSPAYSAIRIVSVDSSAVVEILRRDRALVGVQQWNDPDRIVVGDAATHRRGSPQTTRTTYVLREDGAILDMSNDERAFYGDTDDLGRYAIRWDCSVVPECAIGIVRRDDLRDVLPIEAPAGEEYPSVQFRPGSSDLIALVKSAGGIRVERWSDGGRGARGALATLTIGPRVEAHYLRPDGSAGIFLAFDSSSGGRWYGDLVDLTTGARSPLEIPRGGYPIGSIRISPTQRRVIDPAPPAGTPHIGEARATWIATRRAYGRVASAEVRLTTWAAARAWASLPAHVGYARHGEAPATTDRVYLVVIRAPGIYVPRLGLVWRCSWYFQIQDGRMIEQGCPKGDAPEALPPPLP